MRNLLLGSAFAFMLVTPALGADRTCRGVANGLFSKVEVFFTVDRSGAVTGRSADWTPPGGGDTARMLRGAPMLTLTYGRPTGVGLGPVTQVVGFSMSPGSKAFDHTVLVMILKGDSHEWAVAPIVVRATGILERHSNEKRRQVAMAVGTVAATASNRGPVNVDLLEAIEKAESARLAFRTDDSVIGGITDVDLSHRAARDVLFDKAWSAATQAAKTPARCDKTR